MSVGSTRPPIITHKNRPKVKVPVARVHWCTQRQKRSKRIGAGAMCPFKADHFSERAKSSQWPKMSKRETIRYFSSESL